MREVKRRGYDSCMTLHVVRPRSTSENNPCTYTALSQKSNSVLATLVDMAPRKEKSEKTNADQGDSKGLHLKRSFD